MTRLLSQSEVGTALDCFARWDFAYGGRLAGSALKSKRVAPILSGGRAFGAAAAAWHVTGRMDQALREMHASLEEDVERQREFGVYVVSEHELLVERLTSILMDYSAAEPWAMLPMDPVVERELNVPIPSRSGRRNSSLYRLLCYVDATRQEDGRTRLVEFKLRGGLTSVAQIARSRQIRWYSWAYWQLTGVKPDGVDTIERWNDFPHSPRMVKGKKKSDPERIPSHAKDQIVRPEAYQAVCREHGVEPVQETVDALGQRKWQQMVLITFRDSELEEAGRELVTAAKLIGQLDRGDLHPLRNAKPQNCNGCSFRDICAEPGDTQLVDTLYERIPPKRLREDEDAANGNRINSNRN